MRIDVAGQAYTVHRFQRPYHQDAGAGSPAETPTADARVTVRTEAGDRLFSLRTRTPTPDLDRAFAALQGEVRLRLTTGNWRLGGLYAAGLFTPATYHYFAQTYGLAADKVNDLVLFVRTLPDKDTILAWLVGQQAGTPTPAAPTRCVADVRAILAGRRPGLNV